MTSRILPPEEYPRLQGTLLESVWPNLDPARSSVFVVEHDGAIVATTLLYSAWHLEAAWIEPSCRKNPAVGRALLTFVCRELELRAIDEFLTMSADAGDVPVGAWLGAATKLDGDHYAVAVKVV